MNQSTRSNQERAAFRSANAERMKLWPTQAERALWIVLAPLGFERQVSIESARRTGRGYILDFYHRAAGICVEVDGAYHGRNCGRDGRRDRDLRMLGIETIRLKNSEVLGKLASEIEATLLAEMAIVQARVLGWHPEQVLESWRNEGENVKEPI
jgi:very-short-patch-repair endonuclease